MSTHYNDLHNHEKDEQQSKRLSDCQSDIGISSSNDTSTSYYTFELNMDSNVDSNMDPNVVGTNSLSVSSEAVFEETWHVDPKLHEWLLPVDGDETKAFCSLCNIQLSACHDDLERHARSQEHMAGSQSVSQSPQNSDNVWKSKIKFQKRWLMNPSFNGWLTPVEGDKSKVVCSCCKVELRAHHKSLEQHSKSIKHTINLESQSTGLASLITITDNDYYIELADNEIDGDKVVDDSMEVGPLLNFDPMDAINSTFNGSESQFSSIPIESNEQNMTILDLQCETVDSNIDVLMRRATCSSSNDIANVASTSVNFVARTSSGLLMPSITSNAITMIVPKIEPAVAKLVDGTDEMPTMGKPRSIISIKRSRDLDADDLACVKKQKIKLIDSESKKSEFLKEWEEDLKFKDWIERVEDDNSKAFCRVCSITMLANGVQLTNHIGTVRHIKNRSLEQSKTKLSEETGELIQADSVTNREINESDDEDKSPSSKKPSKDPNFSWSQYKKSYRRAWEYDPILQGWIAPVYGDKYKAACKYCGCILRAHYSDLRLHSRSSKHNNNAYWMGMGPGEKPVTSAENFKQSKPRAPKATKKAKTAPCYSMGNSNWTRYSKNYRMQWESDPLFQGWIAPVDGDETKARCRYCHMLLRAHYNDLKNHGRTTKHANNITYGQPSNDLSCGQPTVTIVPSRAETGRSTAGFRKKKAGSWLKFESKISQSGICELDQPDDSLSSVAALTSLRSFSWLGLCKPTETMVYMPKSLHLDEKLAASLSASTSPQAVFRVRKEPDEPDPGRRKNKSMSMLQRSLKATADSLLQNLIRSVTLWEFVAMKADKIHPNSSRPRMETILMEFQSLHKKVKEFGLEQLTPLTEEELNAKETFNDVLMLNSEELAQTLDLQPGPYRIKDPQQPVVSHNLSIPLRAHSKSTIVCTTNNDPLALLHSAAEEELSLNMSEPTNHLIINYNDLADHEVASKGDGQNDIDGFIQLEGAHLSADGSISGYVVVKNGDVFQLIKDGKVYQLAINGVGDETVQSILSGGVASFPDNAGLNFKTDKLLFTGSNS